MLRCTRWHATPQRLRTPPSSHMTRPRTRSPLGALTLLATTLLHTTGCASASDSAEFSASGTVRDSAGVRIVEHAGLPSELPIWTIPDSAEVRIGSLDGSGPEVLGRVAGLALLPTGAVVVADGQSLELRAFDRSGSHLWSAGRGGEGPGEFIRGILQFSRLGADSLLARDGGGRTMVFAPDGSYARLVRLPEPREGIGQSRVIGALGDGTLIATYNELVASDGEIPAGVMRGAERVALLDSASAVGNTLGEFRSQESMIRVTRGASGQISSMEVRRLSMGRGSVFAVGGTSVVAGETDRLELVRYDAAAGQTTMIRVATPLTLLSDNARQQTLQLDSNAVVSDTLPAFGTVRIDDADRIWVQEFVPVFEERAAQWYVLDGSGAFVARVIAPRRFDPRAFVGDEVWGIRLDELDVPYVERYRIQR